jgi:uncharacterized membrane protein
VETLIRAEDTLPLWAVMSVWVAAAISLERRYRWVARVSGPVLVMLGAMALSNLRAIPTEAPAYDAIWKYIVPVCIPLLLFRANVFAIWRESGRMFLAFHLAVVGTVAGAFAAVGCFAALGERVPIPEGFRAHLAQMTGIMTGSYTGGSVNFVALTRTYDPEKRWVDLTNSLIVADNLVMAFVFVCLFAIVSMKAMRRLFATPYEDAQAEDEGTRSGGGEPASSRAADHWKPKPISLADIALSLGIAVSVAACGTLLADVVSASALPAALKGILGQQYLALTVLCLLVATAFHRPLARIAGAEELGMYLIYLFFFAIGTAADVVKVVTEVPLLFVFCGIIAAFNVAVALALGRLFRRSLEEIVLASNATLGGAPSAAAMAIAKGWTPLVLPAFLVGIWGYVIGTHLGLLVGWLFGVRV